MVEIECTQLVKTPHLNFHHQLGVFEQDQIDVFKSMDAMDAFLLGHPMQVVHKGSQL